MQKIKEIEQNKKDKIVERNLQIIEQDNDRSKVGISNQNPLESLMVGQASMDNQYRQIEDDNPMDTQ